MAVDPSLLHEIGPDGLAREAPVIAYTEKMIEDEQLQLRKYIDENYSKIRDVEREFTNLSMEMKLTAGPKKAALEHLRKKIEASAERIRLAKIKEDQARKEWEAASKAVQDEEALKQKLCEDLSSLVQESSNSQLARLEELNRRLGALNPTRSSGTSTQDKKLAQSTEISAVPVTFSTPHPPRTASRAPENAADQGNAASATNGTSQQSSADGEKKKVHFQGKGRGIGAIPKSRNPVPGWTGAGFDVDNRT